MRPNSLLCVLCVLGTERGTALPVHERVFSFSRRCFFRLVGDMNQKKKDLCTNSNAISHDRQLSYCS